MNSSLNASGAILSDQMPLISVCIPTYNGREHLAACIDSIRSQTFADFEVVICDDQSSDGTLDFARQLAEGDERFRFIPNPRRLGLASNWNNCVNEARGEWIKFVFQDDTIAPACLDKLLGACRDSGKPFGFCDRDFIFENGTSERQREYSNWHRQRVHDDFNAEQSVSPEHVIRIAANALTHNLVGEPTVTLINKSLFNELGGFDEGLIQLCDAEFWSRIMIHHGGVFVPESLASFRIHAKATTTLNNRQRAFRGQVLDTLLYWYKIAFGSQFKPMRNAKVSGKSTLMLRLGCANYAAKAWKEARESSGATAGNSSDSMLADWKLVKSLYPALQPLVYLGLAVRIVRKVQRRINRKAMQPI